MPFWSFPKTIFREKGGCSFSESAFIWFGGFQTVWPYSEDSEKRRFVNNDPITVKGNGDKVQVAALMIEEGDFEGRTAKRER